MNELEKEIAAYKSNLIGLCISEMENPFSMADEVIEKYTRGLTDFSNEKHTGITDFPVVEEILQKIKAQFPDQIYFTRTASIPLIIEATNNTSDKAAVDLFAKLHPEGIVVKPLTLQGNNSIIDYVAQLERTDEKKYEIGMIKAESDTQLNTACYVSVEQEWSMPSGEIDAHLYPIVQFPKLGQQDLSFTITKCRFILINNERIGARTEFIFPLEPNSKVRYYLYPSAILGTK